MSGPFAIRCRSSQLKCLADFEAVVGVRYLYDSEAENRDSRVIAKDGSVSVKAMVEIPLRV